MSRKVANPSRWTSCSVFEEEEEEQDKITEYDDNEDLEKIFLNLQEDTILETEEQLEDSHDDESSNVSTQGIILVPASPAKTIPDDDVPSSIPSSDEIIISSAETSSSWKRRSYSSPAGSMESSPETKKKRQKCNRKTVSKGQTRKFEVKNGTTCWFPCFEYLCFGCATQYHHDWKQKPSFQCNSCLITMTKQKDDQNKFYLVWKKPDSPSVLNL